MATSLAIETGASPTFASDSITFGANVTGLGGNPSADCLVVVNDNPLVSYLSNIGGPSTTRSATGSFSFGQSIVPDDLALQLGTLYYYVALIFPTGNDSTILYGMSYCFVWDGATSVVQTGASRRPRKRLALIGVC